MFGKKDRHSVLFLLRNCAIEASAVGEEKKQIALWHHSLTVSTLAWPFSAPKVTLLQSNQVKRSRH